MPEDRGFTHAESKPKGGDGTNQNGTVASP